ncbi:MAG: YjfB family protein [Lachnospiraceae bacterium]|nr:YjfB family protein [Roseburia sp. 1XD42-69]MCX4319279.1 YjfB family protein [Lachnospiraceae bacterium]
MLPLDIAGLSTALAQTKTQNDVGVLMLSKSLDLTETLGEGMVEILDASAMESSVTPYLGSNIDYRV